jgi:hypothetical protein
MPELKVTTPDGFGEDGIFPIKIVSVGEDSEKSKRTPAGAIPIDRLSPDMDVHPQSRGFNEIHINIDRGDDIDSVEQEIELPMSFASADEISIVFSNYRDVVEKGDGSTEPTKLDSETTQWLVDTVSKYTDILPVPLFRELVYEIDEELRLQDPYFEMYLQSVVTFLNHVDEATTNQPIMGVIPIRLGREQITKLFDIYKRFQVDAFCIDMDRLKFTANSRLPTFYHIIYLLQNENLLEKSLIYLINAERGDFRTGNDTFPAADIASIGFGVDVIGGRRVGPRMADPDDEDTDIEVDESSFYIFDREKHIYRKMNLNDLHRRFPNSDMSAFDVEEVVNECRENPDNRYQYQPLINSEQISLSAMQYRKGDYSGTKSEYIREKPGVTDGMVEKMADARLMLMGTDENTDEQAGIGDF